MINLETLYKFSTTNNGSDSRTNKRRNIIFNIRNEHDNDSIRKRRLSIRWKIINNIRLFIFKFINTYNISINIIKFDGMILNNYHQSFDSLNVGDKACFDVIIKQVMMNLILKVSVNIEGVIYLVEKLKKTMCCLPNRKMVTFISWLHRKPCCLYS